MDRDRGPTLWDRPFRPPSATAATGERGVGRGSESCTTRLRLFPGRNFGTYDAEMRIVRPGFCGSLASRARLFCATNFPKPGSVTSSRSPAPVDCASRVHLCHARCCSFVVELSRQDVEEGGLLWDIEQPYLLRREADGLCSHLDRKTQACGVYQNRPAGCRTYDCRTDQRVWIDFEKRIPAPMPERPQGG